MVVRLLSVLLLLLLLLPETSSSKCFLWQVRGRVMPRGGPHRRPVLVVLFPSTVLLLLLLPVGHVPGRCSAKSPVWCASLRL